MCFENILCFIHLLNVFEAIAFAEPVLLAAQGLKQLHMYSETKTFFMSACLRTFIWLCIFNSLHLWMCFQFAVII